MPALLIVASRAKRRALTSKCMFLYCSKVDVSSAGSIFDIVDRNGSPAPNHRAGDMRARLRLAWGPPTFAKPVWAGEEGHSDCRDVVAPWDDLRDEGGAHAEGAPTSGPLRWTWGPSL